MMIQVTVHQTISTVLKRVEDDTLFYEIGSQLGQRQLVHHNSTWNVTDCCNPVKFCRHQCVPAG